LMTSPGTQRTAGQLRGRSDRKQGGRSAAFFRELIGRRKICGGCLITPRSPEKIPNPSSRALLRVSAAQMMVVAPGWVRFVHGITWISKNCGPIKGKERGKTSRQIADYFGEPFKRGKNCDTCPISSRTPREDSQTFMAVRCSEYLRRRWRLLPPPGCTLLMTSAAPQRTRGQLRGRSDGKLSGRFAG